MFVVVDIFSKMVNVITYHKLDDMSHFSNMFFKEVIGLHGMPKKIVPNRDVKF